MRALKIAAAALVLAAVPAFGQRLPPPPPPVVTPQAQFVAAALADSVYFGPGGTLLDARARTVLANQALYLNQNPHLRARIEGHSDERGTREYSLAVSERRAAAVRNYLVSLGVETSRLTIVPWGKERPASTAAGPAATALNRRVVTIIEP